MASSLSSSVVASPHNEKGDSTTVLGIGVHRSIYSRLTTRDKTNVSRNQQNQTKPFTMLSTASTQKLTNHLKKGFKKSDSIFGVQTFKQAGESNDVKNGNLTWSRLLQLVNTIMVTLKG
jgi:hypothetical protein